MSVYIRRNNRDNLSEYGISIPLLASRADQIIAALKANTFGRSNPINPISIEPAPIGADELALSHSPAYCNAVMNDPDQVIKDTYELVDPDGSYRRYDPEQASLPLAELRDQQLLEAGATLWVAKQALKTGFGYFLGGGMHHAQRGFARGFCMVNDIAITLRKLQQQGLIKRAVVIDIDAHKGDGTAALFSQDTSVTTLSIHMGAHWPMDMPRHLPDGSPDPAFIPSDVEIPIESGANDSYLPKLRQGLAELSQKMGEVDLAIVVNGSDPSFRDILPSTVGLTLDDETMLKRDMLVWRWLKERNLASCWLMAGGYGPDVFRIHARFLTEICSEICAE